MQIVKKKVRIKLLIITFVILLTFSEISILNLITAKESKESSTKIETSTTFESFEKGIAGAEQDGWVFANPTRWTTTKAHSLNGQYSLEQEYNSLSQSKGLLFDGVQFQSYNITNGSIDGWVYSTSYDKSPAFYLRTTPQTQNQSCSSTHSYSICFGYQLLIYSNFIQLNRLDNGIQTILGSYTLNEYYNYAWWHLRLATIGSEIEGWVSTSESFTAIPQINVPDTVYTQGYAAISGRTNYTMNDYTYYDAITINNGSIGNPTGSVDLTSTGIIGTNGIIGTAGIVGTTTQKILNSSFINKNMNYLVITGLGIVGIIGVIIIVQSKRNTKNSRVIQSKQKEKNFQRGTNNTNRLLRGNICINCGSRIEPDDAFCSNCGTPILIIK